MTRRESTTGLGTAMDARALNVQQTRALFNPTPEVDSLAEEVAGLLRHGVPPTVVADLTTRCRELLQSNLEEGKCEMSLAEIFEREVQRCLLTPVADRLTVRSVAARLRAPLGEMLDPTDGVAYFKACCTVRDVINAVPAEELLTASMRNQLRGRRYGLLASLVEVTV